MLGNEKGVSNLLTAASKTEGMLDKSLIIQIPIKSEQEGSRASGSLNPQIIQTLSQSKNSVFP